MSCANLWEASFFIDFVMGRIRISSSLCLGRSIISGLLQLSANKDVCVSLQKRCDIANQAKTACSFLSMLRQGAALALSGLWFLTLTRKVPACCNGTSIRRCHRY
ncbi:hypothetical protein JOE21_003541 [Desmospora profundinema]|uniref:Uncharacterized protein n=1 Tax=Desmospora profundinema TaxID=1571184 RepID=A0ABU1IRV5_9BACL|nr:hypothetical protein [Desmospora profundinema]